MQPERKERENDAVCDPQRADETEALGERLAKTLHGGADHRLYGRSRRGKKRRSPAGLRADSIPMRVTSPTYTIVNEYTRPSAAVPF